MTETHKRASPFREGWRAFWADPALNGVVLLLLGVSAVSTWRGLADFVAGQAGEGALALVGAVVFGLTLAMYVALREVLSPRGVLPSLFSVILYLLLAIWSVGFGYGLWWGLLAGRTATEDSFRQAATAIERSAGEVRAEVAAAAALMKSAAALSDAKARTEETRGGTCGVASTPGDGPLARARRETRAEIATLSAAISGDWLETATARLDSLDGPVAAALGETGGAANRQTGFERAYAEARRAANAISADARSRGRVFARQLNAKADRLDEAPVAGRAPYCYDPDLAASLRAAAEALDRDFEIAIPPFQFSDGAEGVARAIEQLWSGVGGLARFDPEPMAAVLSGRSLIALVAAIAVDLAIFVFALVQSVKARAVRRLTRRAAAPKDRGSLEKIWSWFTKTLGWKKKETEGQPPSANTSRERALTTSPKGRASKQSSDPDNFWEALGDFDPPDVEIDPDGAAQWTGLPAEYRGRVQELVKKFDRFQDNFTAVSEKDQRQKNIDDAMRVLDKLSALDPPVHPFGAVGGYAGGNDQYDVVEERVDGEGEPGDILELHRAGFRVNDKVIARKARVVITGKPKS